MDGSAGAEATCLPGFPRWLESTGSGRSQMTVPAVERLLQLLSGALRGRKGPPAGVSVCLSTEAAVRVRTSSGAARAPLPRREYDGHRGTEACGVPVNVVFGGATTFAGRQLSGAGEEPLLCDFDEDKIDHDHA